MPHLAQLNIAEFRRPSEHPDNQEFFDNLDAVNALAEASPGFIWRMVGDGANDATGIRPFDNPDMAINLSVWENVESLAAFVYRNKAHRVVMRKRANWFEEMAFYLVLWWVPEGHIPSIEEAKLKLAMLEQNGPSPEAFTFKTAFPAPSQI